jgi:hypothetical protein
MGARHVHVARSPPAASVDVLARWWTSAQKAERFALVRASIHGDPQAPPLEALQLAIYLAETAAGEVST